MFPPCPYTFTDDEYVSCAASVTPVCDTCPGYNVRREDGTFFRGKDALVPSDTEHSRSLRERWVQIGRPGNIAHMKATELARRRELENLTPKKQLELDYEAYIHSLL